MKLGEDTGNEKQNEKQPGERIEYIGQALVEFAVVLPLLLFLVFMMIEFSRMFHAYLVAENGARQGIRYAVTGEYDVSYCGGFEQHCEIESEEKAARLASIKDVAYLASQTIMRNDQAGR